ncbi:MAG TPA: hypothetical protein VI758_07995, partial [Bacteroidota bacterium]
LILDPLNVRLGYPALLSRVSKGDWRTVAALWCGVLLCGVFWEMWNYCSYPKWVYHVPFVGFAHIFEMPILGYLGYFPFALELYAVVCLVRGLCGRGNIEECLAITGEEV